MPAEKFPAKKCCPRLHPKNGAAARPSSSTCMADKHPAENHHSSRFPHQPQEMPLIIQRIAKTRMLRARAHPKRRCRSRRAGAGLPSPQS